MKVWHDKGRVLDQALGVARFERLLTRALYQNHDLARIYDAATNTVINEYRRGARVQKFT